MTGEASELRAAIAALKNQRGLLGDAVVNTSIEALSRKLEALEQKSASEEPLRRNVTVVFADVSGFTAICRSHDPENVTEAINALWTSLDSIIVSRGGTVDKHIGDCVMAVWGASGVREDDPARAVDAALAMRDATHGISTGSMGLIPPFSIRIGIHTGPAFISRVGLTREFAVMGDTVNVASRLQGKAPPGSVIISKTTWKLAGSVFQCRERPPCELKGIDQPLVTFLVEGRMNRALSGPSGAATPMVGRAEELDLLKKGWIGVASSGPGLFVTITGEAGMGKSRLLHEFIRWVDRGEQSHSVYQGGCTPDMPGVPCGLLRNMLCRAFDIADSDSAREACAKLVEGLQGRLSSDEAVQTCFFAGFSTGTGENGNHSAASAGRRALMRFFRELSAEGPLLFCLEDIHWADSVSLDFFREMVPVGSSRGMMALCLTRPSLRLPMDEMAGKDGFLTIDLTPLSPEECRAVTAGMLSGTESVPEELWELISRSSDGNPFFVEELVKMLMEDGVIDLDTGCVNDHALSAVRVPATLTGVLQARLDSLPTEERRVLQAASVVGRVFWDTTLSSICEGAGASGVERWLSGARNRDLIRKSEQSAIRDSREYLFKHAVLRDVTYDTVLLKARRKYHLLVADWLRENAGDRIGEFQGLVALHLEKGGNRREALKWYAGAGVSAMGTSAYTEAASLLRRALGFPEASEDQQLQARLRLDLASSLEKLCRYSEAEEELAKVIASAEALSLPGLEAEARSTLAWTAAVTGRRNEAKRHAQSALSAAKASGEPALIARAVMRMADHEPQPDYETILPYYSQALEVYEGMGNHQGMAIALLNMGNTALAFSRLREAEEYYRRSLKMYEEAGSRWGVANCTGNLGCVASELGEHSRALELYQESLDISRSIGDMEGQAICCLNLGDAHLAMADPPAAEERFTEAMEAALSAGLRPLSLAAVRGLAETGRLGGLLNESAVSLLVISRDKALDHDEAKKIQSLLSDLRHEMGDSRYESAVQTSSSLTPDDLFARFPGR
jgi:class 3 adenylate cyclase/tetratricopeptide (TPR) repeat protein